MTATTAAPQLLAIALGEITINGTRYKVSALPTGEKARGLGIRGNYAVEGPKGSKFLVTDHGPRYELTSVSVTGSAPRPLRGLKRSHFAAFGVEA